MAGTTKTIIDQVAAQLGMYKKEAKQVVEATFTALTEQLKNEGRVQIKDFGTFELRTVSAREGQNPRTGEKIEIPERNQVYFRSSKNLKNFVN